VRRVRAIESRWLPLHEQSLAQLQLSLDENDRAEGARIRWASHRRQGA
jgi:vacuolar-type H+-ATPase subunit D/Vma8